MLPEATMAEMSLAMAGNQQERVYAEFFTRPRQDMTASKEQGRPIFVDQPYVKIMVPGDKDSIVVRPVRDQDKMRFPRQWQAYEMNMEQPIEGTMLSEWPGVTRAQVEELKHYGIRTLEELVEMPDSQAQKFMGINTLRQKAAAYMEAAQATAPLEALREENEGLKNLVSELQNDIAELRQMVQDGAIQDDS
jgi:hypothetical protein